MMVHQSPRSSAEFEELMQAWSQHFTCIAPDTPGFGQSDPLPGEPEIDDFADAIAAFIRHMGMDGCGAYGFHSGGVILSYVAKRHPDALSALAIGGYGQWTEEERRIFGERYVPPFVLGDYGEHMVWLWNRILEQSWFFPWFDIRDEARLPNANYNLEQTQETVEDLLNAGPAYRFGYAAVLRAPRDLPPPGAKGPPLLISAFDGDPLQSHIDRMGPLPDNWQARKVATPADHVQVSLDFLLDNTVSVEATLVEDSGEGFITVDGCTIHWAGERGASRLVLHGPGAELSDPGPDAIAIDVPGHGLSQAHADIETIVRGAAEQLGASEIVWPDVPAGELDKLYPGLEPDRFGTHLIKAWAIARAGAFYAPWYAVGPDTAITLKAEDNAAEAIALRARALLRAGPAARQWHEQLVASQAARTPR